MGLAIAIAGASGRMGRALIAASRNDPRLTLCGGTERAGADTIGLDLGLLDGKAACGALVHDTVAQACAGAQVWIDFTTPQATCDALAVLIDKGVKAAIIGTTGFDTTQTDTIKAASSQMVIVQSGNFSLGVNLMAGLVRQAAERLGPDWDIEVHERHHRHKVDAPSGTALLLGKAAASGRKIDHGAAAVYARQGVTGPRVAGSIGYSVTRAGGIIGDHEVLFACEDEHVSLSHHAASRAIFAKGALFAALWTRGQANGLYDMADVLGL
ncbi:MAG: hypothetical protein RL186_361 [Pseudomonadota bacterium]